MSRVLSLAALLAALLAAAARPAAAAKEVDDFEVGAFYVWSNGPFTDHEVVIGEPHIHVLSDSRHVVVDATTGSATASLNPGLTLNDAAEVNLEGDGIGMFRYEWEDPIDLTQDGVYDRVVVELDAGVVGGQVMLTITSEGVGEAQYRVLNWAGHQDVVFYLDAFLFASPKQALSMTVRLSSPAPESLYLVADIRLTVNEVQAVNYEGDFVAIQTPPVPTPRLRFRTYDITGNPLYRMGIQIVDARDAAGEIPEIRAEWESAQGMGGELAGIFFERAGINPHPFLPTTFRLGVDPTPFNNQFPEITFPPDPVVGDRSCLLEFPIVLVDAAGSQVGVSSTQLVLDIHEGQPLEFGRVIVSPVEGAIAGGPFTGFELEFELIPSGPIDLDAKFLDATWISDWSPESGVTGVAELAAPPSSPLAIVAAPSVTRAGTVLRASRPFSPGTAIAIFDVGGRTIRRLADLEGSQSVDWDGRNEFGDSVPSGVYFARIAGATSSAVRIVKVR